MKKNKNNWTLFEKSLLLTNIILGLVLFFITNEYNWLSILGIIASITSTFSIIYAAKRRIENYVWGFIGSLTYGIVAYAFGNTGEWMLNIIYFLPANCIGYYLWKKHITNEDNTLEIKKLNFRQAIVFYPLCVFVVVIYAYIISLPLVQSFLYGKIYVYKFSKYLIDSLSTVFNIVGMILLVKRYCEQWILFIIVNICNVILWIITFDPMMILLWVTLLVNSVYGYISWKKSFILQKRYGSLS